MTEFQFNHRRVLERLRGIISQELVELEQAYNSRPVTAVAWIARNLLELGIWSGYCSMSEKNANHFFKDAARDAVHMLNLPVEVAKDAGLAFTTVRQELIKKGKQDNIDNIDKGFLAVLDAARSIGAKKQFVGMNKVLSKFAHPTAFRVMSPDEHIERLREVFHELGRRFAVDALSVLQTTLASLDE